MFLFDWLRNIAKQAVLAGVGDAIAEIGDADPEARGLAAIRPKALPPPVEPSVEASDDDKPATGRRGRKSDI
jgi:hypothetical protein